LWIHERAMRLPVGELMAPYTFALATKPVGEAAVAPTPTALSRD